LMHFLVSPQFFFPLYWPHLDFLLAPVFCPNTKFLAPPFYEHFTNILIVCFINFPNTT
jgi:hypothetical protein